MSMQPAARVGGTPKGKLFEPMVSACGIHGGLSIDVLILTQK